MPVYCPIDRKHLLGVRDDGGSRVRCRRCDFSQGVGLNDVECSRIEVVDAPFAAGRLSGLLVDGQRRLVADDGRLVVAVVVRGSRDSGTGVG